MKDFFEKENRPWGSYIVLSEDKKSEDFFSLFGLSFNDCVETYNRKLKEAKFKLAATTAINELIAYYQMMNILSFIKGERFSDKFATIPALITVRSIRQ